jgi:hypothetical protein
VTSIDGHSIASAIATTMSEIEMQDESQTSSGSVNSNTRKSGKTLKRNVDRIVGPAIELENMVSSHLTMNV